MSNSISSLKLDTLEKDLADIEGRIRAAFPCHCIALVQAETTTAEIERRLWMLNDAELLASAAYEKIRPASAVKGGTDHE